MDPLPSLKHFERFHSNPEIFHRQEEERKIKMTLKTAAKLRDEEEKKVAQMVSRPQKMKNVMVRMASESQIYVHSGVTVPTQQTVYFVVQLKSLRVVFSL